MNRSTDTNAVRIETLRITGLTCADCAAKLEQTLRNLAGVEEVSLNFMAAKLTIRHTLDPDAIRRTIVSAGYGVSAPAAAEPVHAGFFHTHRRALTTAASGLLLLLAWGLAGVLPIAQRVPVYILAILIGGLWTMRRGMASLRHGTFDMNALMTIAVIGASILGEWNEAATVAFLFSLSNMLESYTMERTRQSLRGLMDLAPREALVRRDGVEARLPVDAVRVGDTVIIKPGEKVPVDGVVTRGTSAVNQSAITGESLPVEKVSGDEVFAGTLNTAGALDVRVTTLAADTTLSRIIHVVEEAQAKRAPSQAFVDRFARVYTPIVLITAVGLAVLPPLLFQLSWHDWIYRALALIVVACPCALVISTPVAIVSAIGNAARHGVLIKGGAYLEQLGRLSVMAFDKTGTVTEGRPVVTDIVPMHGAADMDVLALAAAVEARASHVLADAIVRKARDVRISIPDVDDAVSWPGLGAQATVNGVPTYVGNRRFLAEHGIDVASADAMLTSLETQGKSAMLVGQQHAVRGIIAAEDRIRSQAMGMVKDLHRAGIRRIALLTGDHRETADRIAAHLGIDDVRANLLPEDKVHAMRELLLAYGSAGMVGDGINDAPALATATVGVAMGIAGTDTAMETADMTLMTDDLTKLPYAVRLSRRTLRIIKQNIALSLGIKVLAIALIFPGWLTLWLAVLADMGASILVTLNGLRLMRGTAEDRPAGCCADGCGHGACR